MSRPLMMARRTEVHCHDPASTDARSSGHRALAQLLRTESDLVRRVGAVTGRTGRADAAYVEERPLRRVASDFRYDTYLASLSAMNFGGGEIRVRETYQSRPIPAR